MMIQLFIITSLALIANCQQYPPSQQYGSQPTPKPAQVYPPAQVHYVNIGADLAGDYKFGYDTGKGGNGQSFREETRLPDGTVQGAYGYVDTDGKQRIVKYTAGKEGFKVDSDSAPEPSGPPSRPSAPPPQTYRAPAPQTYSAPAPQIYRAPAPQTYSAPAPQTYSEPSLQAYRGAAPQTYRAPQPVLTGYSQPAAQPISTYRPASPGQTLRSVQVLPQSYQPYTSSSPTLSSPQIYRAPAPQSSPSLQQYRPAAPARVEEATTWGPPVINTALLNYNIGSQQG